MGELRFNYVSVTYATRSRLHRTRKLFGGTASRRRFEKAGARCPTCRGMPVAGRLKIEKNVLYCRYIPSGTCGAGFVALKTTEPLRDPKKSSAFERRQGFLFVRR